VNDERSAAFQETSRTFTSVFGIEGFAAENRLVPNAKHASISGIPSTQHPDAEHEDAADGREAACSRNRA